MNALLIDGSYGEGGGQVLRAALALAAITGRRVRRIDIRSRRPKPGLQPQHHACVRAAARICSGYVEGDGIGSQGILFQCSGRWRGRRRSRAGCGWRGDGPMSEWVNGWDAAIDPLTSSGATAIGRCG